METTLNVRPLLDKIAEMKRQTKEYLTAQFKEMFVKFWEENPLVTAVAWVQYIPTYNDGEACTLSVLDPVFTNANSKQLQDIDVGEVCYNGDDEGVWCVYVGEVNNKEYAHLGLNAKSMGQLSLLIQSSSLEEVLESMFEFNVTVIATRDGFSVEENCQYC